MDGQPGQRAHSINSRDIEGGFEYFCIACPFVARWQRGKYTILERGSPKAHKRAAGEKEETHGAAQGARKGKRKRAPRK